VEGAEPVVLIRGCRVRRSPRHRPLPPAPSRKERGRNSSSPQVTPAPSHGGGSAVTSGNATSQVSLSLDVLEPVVARYRNRMKRRYFRGDAAYANPGIYEFLEAEGNEYTIRLPANAILQERIGWLLKRPVGRPPHDVRQYYASFRYQAASWSKPRRVVAKVEWHPGELYPRVWFIVTNMSRPAERVTLFYNQRGTAEQHIKEGKNAILWTRLSCRRFAANAVRQCRAVATACPGL